MRGRVTCANVPDGRQDSLVTASSFEHLLSRRESAYVKQRDINPQNKFTINSMRALSKYPSIILKG